MIGWYKEKFVKQPKISALLISYQMVLRQSSLRETFLEAPFGHLEYSQTLQSPFLEVVCHCNVEMPSTTSEKSPRRLSLRYVILLPGGLGMYKQNVLVYALERRKLYCSSA